MGILIGKRGQTLDSLQYLVNLLLIKKKRIMFALPWIQKITEKKKRYP